MKDKKKDKIGSAFLYMSICKGVKDPEKWTWKKTPMVPGPLPSRRDIATLLEVLKRFQQLWTITRAALPADLVYPPNGGQNEWPLRVARVMQWLKKLLDKK